MAALAQMIGVCTVRNGENCKRCIYYGKPCESFKAHHRGKKPKDLDDVKSEEQRKFFKKAK